MIQAKELYKSFDDLHVLKGISAVFEKGKNNLIIGKSGSGKTVFMKCLLGLIELDSGSILYDDRNFSRMDFQEKKRLRQEIGMLFQGGALFDSLTVEKNIMFPLTMFTRWSYQEKRKRVDYCLDRVNMAGSNELMPAELSGGMNKRVAIARAIVMEPGYLFCDEPNSGLDPKTGVLIDNLINEITKDLGMTTIINTHDMNSVLAIGDQVIFLNQGEVAWKGAKEEILDTTDPVINEFVYATEMAKRLKGK